MCVFVGVIPQIAKDIPDLELLPVAREVQVTSQQNPAVATIGHHSTCPRRKDTTDVGQVGRSFNMAWLPESTMITMASPAAPRRTSIDPKRCWPNRPKLTRKQRSMVAMCFHDCHDVSLSSSIMHLRENPRIRQAKLSEARLIATEAEAPTVDGAK